MSPWYIELSDDDLEFIRNFVALSGSLKKVAELYGISYPTVRIRLDGIIRKLNAVEEREKDPFLVKVMRLATDGAITLSIAREIIEIYEEEEVVKSKAEMTTNSEGDKSKDE
ncbi:DUF2089 family protein [Lactobacillus sp. DCY120]|uniref:DUF2089 family protein n=1 Tax=Bombilactobacillus apium TaxID=2675299 RepID=A0A850R6X9_9LACO|nr:DUF2089 family protein [Bombilactobacillus apium]NVY96587.1 DUF2089 family protein [Bombilactobacillus apium]